MTFCQNRGWIPGIWEMIKLTILWPCLHEVRAPGNYTHQLWNSTIPSGPPPGHSSHPTCSRCCGGGGPLEQAAQHPPAAALTTHHAHLLPCLANLPEPDTSSPSCRGATPSQPTANDWLARGFKRPSPLTSRWDQFSRTIWYLRTGCPIWQHEPYTATEHLKCTSPVPMCSKYKITHQIWRLTTKTMQKAPLIFLTYMLK